MAEYIEREAAKNAIYAAMRKHDEYDSCERKIIAGLAEADDAIDAIHAADVASVRHGRWIWDKDGMDWGIGSWRCSECKNRPETWWQGERSSPRNKSGHYYCPNCGAKMDKEVDT